jgi:hypothetical protein
MLLEEFMPVFDVSDAVATVVEADLATTWSALMAVDLIEVGRQRPIVAVLGALRMLPDLVSHLLHGELPPRQPEHLRLRDSPRSRSTRAAGCCSACASRTRSRSASSASSGAR